MGDLDLPSRAKAALLGAFVADAATMGLHWIYDQGKISTLVAEKGVVSHPEFFEPPSCPFYKAESGASSPYGGEMYPLLKFLAENDGKLDGKQWAKYLAAHYKASTAYINGTSKKLVQAVDAGKEYPETGDPTDTEANALVKAIPIAALYAGQPEMVGLVEVAVRAQQNSDRAVAFGLAAALILEKVLLGSSSASALEWASTSSSIAPEVQKALGAANSLKETPFSELVTKLGPSCNNPGALQCATVAAAVSHNYVVGVRTNMLAGGDNCSRGMLVGALLGAEFGQRAIPTEWTDKTTQFEEVEELTDKLIGLRKA